MIFDKRDCALVVVSTGKKIVGELLDTGNGDAIATGLQTVFTLTVGMLNWTVEDLGTTYDAKCDVEITDTDADGCKGLRVVTPALREEDKMLLLGVDELYMGELYDLNELLVASEQYLGMTMRSFVWKPLVSIDSAPAILLPRNFEIVVDTAESDFHSATSTSLGCSVFLDQLIRSVLTNHLYAEESLQMSYTAAFHFLLKNAVLHTTAMERSHSVIDFLGNYQTLRVQVSIPSTNVLISFVGCGLLVASAIWTAVAHRRAKRITETEAANNINFVAEVMLNTGKYPRSVPKMSLDQPAPGGGAPRRTKLDDLEFASTIFSDKPAKPESSLASKLVKSAKSAKHVLSKPK